MAITRTPIVDDSGLGEDGTILDAAWKNELYDQIDAYAALLGPSEDIPFFNMAGPTALRTFTFPDANATILTSITPVVTSHVGPHAIGGAAASTAQFTLKGTFAERNCFVIESTIQPPAGQNARLCNVAGTIAEAGSGTHALVASLWVDPPVVTGGAATVTNAAAFYINGPPTATVTGANYAAWIVGPTRLDGHLTFGGAYDVGDGAGSSPALVYAETAIVVGTNPAATGVIRIPNAVEIVARNAANNADISILSTSAANKVVLGDGSDDGGMVFFFTGVLAMNGTTSASPALKTNGAILETKLADDSAYATHAALLFKTTTALVALGGGAAPTLGTIGGSGPTAAGQNTWLKMTDSTGAAFWVPAWK